MHFYKTLLQFILAEQPIGFSWLQIASAPDRHLSSDLPVRDGGQSHTLDRLPLPMLLRQTVHYLGQVCSASVHELSEKEYAGLEHWEHHLGLHRWHAEHGTDDHYCV